MSTYRTDVSYIPPSPLGLVGDRWVIEHWCTTCRLRVEADQLVTHAKNHDHHYRRCHDRP